MAFFSKSAFAISYYLYNSNDSRWNKEELNGIAKGSHNSAASEIHTALYPEPARRDSVCPTRNSDNESKNSRHSTKNQCQRIRVFEQVKASDEKSYRADKLKKPEKYSHNLFTIFLWNTGLLYNSPVL